jgi:dTDP-4-amino-4,6-dideoxygalactose transaminase
LSEIIPFNRPSLVGSERENIAEAAENLYLSGNGPFGQKCSALLERQIGCARALLTPSGTAALEIATLLLGLEPGDEVIMPSFTFPTTASCVALRGGVPVFVDIRPDTLNIDENLIAPALTDRTRAILPVHYAGIGCAMDSICEIARERNLAIIEDAAHSIDARYMGRPLGSFGDLGALSFHETKNITCGEGGALLIRDEELIERAEILQEKGTNRSAFRRGDIEKYTWIDVGSSFVLSDINAAFLYAQLEHLRDVTEARRRIWDRYYSAFAELEDLGLARRPHVPAEADHNGHLFYLLIAPEISRDEILAALQAQGVHGVFHYVPLHESPAGSRWGRVSGDLPHTVSASQRLIRLPLWIGMTPEQIDRVVDSVFGALRDAAASRGSLRPD